MQSNVARGSRNPPYGGRADELADRVKAILRDGHILVDGRPIAREPEPAEIEGVVLPLLLWCKQHTPRAAHGLVGIAAPPGAGKTLLAAWLEAATGALFPGEFAFLPLDGYHLPNAILASRKADDPRGNRVSLMKLKGTPATFDAERLLADLRALRSRRDEMLFPRYDRALHEPVANQLRVGPQAKWVFVEGNFLFLDAPPWREIGALFDRKIYLDAGDAVLRSRLAARHAAAGRDSRWIEAHFRRTDGPNIRLVRASAGFADVGYRWDSQGRLGVGE